jgi:enoyl-[acyl-carrier protein] reductase I
MAAFSSPIRSTADMGFLAGKRALVTGILSNRSIAWGIAQALKREVAELAITYVD